MKTMNKFLDQIIRLFPKMAQLVVKMLKQRESLRQEAYTTLVSVHKSMIVMTLSNYNNNNNIRIVRDVHNTGQSSSSYI